MRPNILLTLLLTFFASLALAAQSERTVDIHAWPLSAAKSHSIAKVSYTTTNATVKSYNPPNTLPPTSDEDTIIRIGFHHPTTGKWSGVATAASNFEAGREKKVRLLLSGEGELFHVGFLAGGMPASSASGKGKAGKGKGREAEDVLSVEVVKVQQGERVHLNRPVVLDAEGKLPQKEVEKSFFQK